jgi:hypothetical protein
MQNNNQIMGIQHGRYIKLRSIKTHIKAEVIYFKRYVFDSKFRQMISLSLYILLAFNQNINIEVFF